jgi:LysR family nod box-dependent transcriptional activator
MNTFGVNPHRMNDAYDSGKIGPMRFNKLDLNLLVALDVLLSEASISRAAERLHMSASATSNALARLRTHLGDELLVQVGRKMELTPRGSDREFRIFVSDYSQTTLIPHLTALAWREAPSIRFSFLPHVDNPQRALERGEADLLVMPEDFCSPHHPTEVVLKEAFKCVVWTGNPIARRTLTFEDYADASHVVMQPVGTPAPAFERWFLERYGVSRKVGITTYSFAAAAQLVVGTDRIATVHQRLAQQLQQMLPIALLDPPVPISEMNLAIQWHKYRSTDPGIVWLRHVCHEAAGLMDGAHA